MAGENITINQVRGTLDASLMMRSMATDGTTFYLGRSTKEIGVVA
jgi:hypothetical protein